MSLLQSVFMTLLASPIIYILYGSAYQTSANLLKIVVWYTTFSYIGPIRNIWIVAEEKQKYLWVINLSGAIFNLLLNLLLIKSFGACGAAFASLLTQIFANLILGFIWKPLRENNRMILKSLHPRFAFEEAKKLLGSLLKKEKR